MIRLVFAAALAVGLLGAPRHARAEDRAAAEGYFRAGAKAYAAQSFAVAAEDFDLAYAAMPLPEIAFSGAQAYRRLYRVAAKPEYVQRAVQLYRVYLEHVKSGARVGDAADNLGEMQRELDRLKLAAPALGATAVVGPRTALGVSITIADQRAPDGTALREIGDATGEVAAGLVTTLDGKPLEPYALVDVEAKEHVLGVRADGYVPVEKTAVAVAGQARLVEITLAPRPATVTVTTEPGARLVADGRLVGIAPARAVELAAGSHLLAVLRRGREPFGREVVLTRGEALTLAAPLVRTPRRRVVPWAVGGTAVLAAGALTTTLFAFARDAHASDLRAGIAAGDRPPPDADAYDRAVTSRDHFVTATWLLGGGALVAGGAAVLLYYFDEPASEAVRFAPVVTRGGAGAVFAGRF